MLRLRAALCAVVLAASTARAQVPPRDEAAEASGTYRSRMLAVAAVGGIYVSLYGWLSVAWWTRPEESEDLALHREGWFGADTYAGGADKLGHAWANYTLVRGIGGVLEYGGWSRRASLAAASGLAFGFFTVSEIKDGFHEGYGFSPEDMVVNTAGVALALAFEAWPELDRRFDFRVEYLPSRAFLERVAENGPFNAPEDYTGQRYLLCYHLGSLGLADRGPWLGWTTYVDVTAGFQAVNYKPVPEEPTPRWQHVFFGLSLNLQALLDSPHARGAGARALRFVTEVYQPPYTTLRLGGVDRSSDPSAP